MLFNSYIFILCFLPITFFTYFILTHHRKVTAAKLFLTGASLFFYGWWNVLYLPLLLFSISVNYVTGRQLARLDKGEGVRQSILVCGIVFNVGLLAYYKYADFFVQNLNALGGFHILEPHIILPLAISFHTFQQIAFLVDIYRRKSVESNFLNYVLFVTFFPQLIAGPIVHHSEMMPQFSDRWALVKKYRNVALGLFIFSIGLFKKVVIADYFSVWASKGFDQAEALNFYEAWATSLSYTYQLYFDFSGYTDMAIGAALLFNIQLPQNFSSPYKSTNIQEFWRRWHMTLSRFFRDYLYIPLGGNRGGLVRTCRNVFLTFVIGGLWHGASWMFIIWGCLHGGAFIVHRVWQAIGFKMPQILAWFLTFNFINLTWVFFRAENMDSALKVLRGMAGISTYVVNEYMFKSIGAMVSDVSWAMGGALIFVLFFKNSTEITSWISSRSAKVVLVRLVYLAAGAAATVSLYFIGNVKASEFLYFNF